MRWVNAKTSGGVLFGSLVSAIQFAELPSKAPRSSSGDSAPGVKIQTLRINKSAWLGSDQ